MFFTNIEALGDSLGVRVENSHCWPLFSSSIFDNSWAKHFFGHFLGGSSIILITPMRQARTCGRVLDPGPTPSAPKQWKSDVHVKSLNPVRARSKMTKSKEHSNIKSTQTCQCTAWLSATQNGQGAAENFFTVLESNPSRLTHCKSP